MPEPGSEFPPPSVDDQITNLRNLISVEHPSWRSHVLAAELDAETSEHLLTSLAALYHRANIATDMAIASLTPDPTSEWRSEVQVTHSKNHYSRRTSQTVSTRTETYRQATRPDIFKLVGVLGLTIAGIAAWQRNFGEAIVLGGFGSSCVLISKGLKD